VERVVVEQGAERHGRFLNRGNNRWPML
jgi:hypothetical protein